PRSFLYMIRILITGSNGLLGQKLVYACIGRNNIELIATAKGENRLATKNGYTFETMDITDKEEVGRIISKHKPDCVIHGAAMTNVDACETEQEACRNLNINAVSYIVEACN